MLGAYVTFWYKYTRHFGHLYTLTDGTEVIIFGAVYTPGWHLFKCDVDDLRVIG